MVLLVGVLPNPLSLSQGRSASSSDGDDGGEYYSGDDYDSTQLLHGSPALSEPHGKLWFKGRRLGTRDEFGSNFLALLVRHVHFMSRPLRAARPLARPRVRAGGSVRG